MSPANSGKLQPEVTALLKEGKNEEAVKILIEKHGLSENEALRTILSIESGQNRPAKRSGKDSVVGPRGIGMVMSVLGIIFLVISAYRFLEVRDKMNNWVPSNALVRHLIVDYTEQGAAPVLIYVWDSDTLSYTSTVYASPPDYEIGDSLKIYVNPNVSSVVLIDSFKETYLLTAVFASIGGAFFIIGGLILFYSNKI